MGDRRDTLEQLSDFGKRYGENVAYNLLAQTIFKSPQIIRFLRNAGSLATATTPIGLARFASGALLSELAPTAVAEITTDIARSFGATPETSKKAGDIADLIAGLLTGNLGVMQGRLANISTEAISDESLKAVVKRFRKNSFLRKLARSLLNPEEAKSIFKDESSFEVGLRAIAEKLAMFSNGDPDLFFNALKNASNAKELKANLLAVIGAKNVDDLKKLSNAELTNLLRPMMNIGSTQPEIKEALQKTRNALLQKFSETSAEKLTPTAKFRKFVEQVDIQPESIQFNRLPDTQLQDFVTVWKKRFETIFETQFDKQYSPELRTAASSILSYLSGLEGRLKLLRDQASAKGVLETLKPDEVLTNVRRLTAGLWEALDVGGGDDIVKKRIQKTIDEVLVPFAKGYAEIISKFIADEDASQALKILKNYDLDVDRMKRALDVARTFGMNVAEFSDVFLGQADKSDLFRSLNKFLSSGGGLQERLKSALDRLNEMDADDYRNFVKMLRDAYFEQVKGLAETDANEKILRDLTKAFENFVTTGKQAFKQKVPPEKFVEFSNELDNLVNEVKNLQTIKSTAFWEQLGKGRPEGSQTAFKLKELAGGNVLGSWWDRISNFISGVLTSENVNPRQAEIIAQKLAIELPGDKSDILDVLAKAIEGAKQRRELATGVIGGRLAESLSDLVSSQEPKTQQDLQRDEFLNFDLDEIAKELNQTTKDEFDLDDLTFDVFGGKRKIKTKQGREMEMEDLLARIAEVESGFDEKAKSPKGALGLFQFLPSTAKERGIDPLDPEQAYRGAKQLIEEYLNEFGDLRLALAAYNAGANRVRKLLREFEDIDTIIDLLPNETIAYIRKILN